MLSHGVDISRLNVMMMLGLPLTTAEFIQTSARVGRSRPGLVHVLHKIGRERDAETFRHFTSFVTPRRSVRGAYPSYQAKPASLDTDYARLRRGTPAHAHGATSTRPASHHTRQAPRLRQELRRHPRGRRQRASRRCSDSPGRPTSSFAKRSGSGLPRGSPTWKILPPASSGRTSSARPAPMTSLRDVEASAPIHD